ncbi:hypothetical protein, partial [Geitlerinema sp. PCC 9228]|uniref:arginine synthesis PII-interacting regulator PirA n=1 Tax=Geitlerinema sp. PCC 9228 TaxID=111611 RepID=UPI0008F9D86A
GAKAPRGAFPPRAKATGIPSYRKFYLKKAAQTHQQNVQRYLQRRIEAARARGDEKLVKILEAEANYQK